MNKQDDTAKSVDEPAQFIVGVGASAGGLEAITELFRNLPAQAPAAYVIVQHLSPTHKSLLSTLVSRETHLQVVELEGETKPKRNVVYTTPPNRNVVYANGSLRLSEGSTDPGAPKPSIDKFFLSLAENIGEKAVGIVLSGTGRDGSFGVQAIRGAGGITIAQDEKTAKYEGMPLAAVETGCVDIVLSSKEIGALLGKILDSPRDLGQFRAPTRGDHPLAELLQIVLARTRVDFRDYKPTTIRRRLEKRMIACGTETQTDYLALCRANPQEVDALFRDFLISVTWFFRDPKEFGGLRDHLARLGERRSSEPMRIWITGCATGEEAYTVGILCAEALGGIDKLARDRVQIFATDIDGAALEQARKGVYARAALDHVPEEYVETYFKVVKDTVVVKPQLKDVVIFSYHNVCQDPPFIHVDLVCCRNLLIYFNPELQQKVLSRLHYALSDDGLLFLGTAETVSVSDDLFTKTGSSANIFRKRILPNQLRSLTLAGFLGASPRAVDAKSVRTVEAADEQHRGMFDSLARALGPNSVLTSEDHRILRVYGDIGRYVTINERTHLKMSLAMLRAPLAQEARTLATVSLR
ncbi:MAG: chemotaxis protein CheB, partial [Pseudomonadota bacterium]